MIMSPQEFKTHFVALGLDPTEAATLFDVAPRTVFRWLEGEAVPGPVEQAVRAWRRLHERGLAWRPDSVSVLGDDQQQIAAQRQHAVGVPQRHDAEAVVLDLVEPVRAGGRRLGRRWQARFNEASDRPASTRARHDA